MAAARTVFAGGMRVTMGTDSGVTPHGRTLDELDYRRERFEAAVRDADLVVDLVGGEIPFRSLQVLRPGRLLVHVPSDVLPSGLATAGAVQVLLHDGSPLAAAADAHDLAERTHLLGKIILNP